MSTDFVFTLYFWCYIYMLYILNPFPLFFFSSFSSFQAMTPPEFNLDGFVEGMEGFDVEEDAEV